MNNVQTFDLHSLFSMQRYGEGNKYWWWLNSWMSCLQCCFCVCEYKNTSSYEITFCPQVPSKIKSSFLLWILVLVHPKSDFLLCSCCSQNLFIIFGFDFPVLYTFRKLGCLGFFFCFYYLLDSCNFAFVFWKAS